MTEQEKKVFDFDLSIDQELLKLIKISKDGDILDIDEYVETIYNLLRFLRFNEIHPLPPAIMEMKREQIQSSEILAYYCTTEKLLKRVCIGDEVKVGRVVGRIITLVESVVIVDRLRKLHSIAFGKFFNNYTMLKYSKLHHILDIENGRSEPD
ncbi:MAG: hypothetical protein QW533_05750 [Thermoplasmata archaeon]